MKRYLRLLILKALGIIFVKHFMGQWFEKIRPEKIQLQKKSFCKPGTVLQIGYDYNAICVYLFVFLYVYLWVYDSVSL